jgi:hypothetical protein
LHIVKNNKNIVPVLLFKTSAIERLRNRNFLLKKLPPAASFKKMGGEIFVFSGFAAKK